MRMHLPVKFENNHIIVNPSANGYDPVLFANFGAELAFNSNLTMI